MRVLFALLAVAVLARAAPVQVEKAPIDLLHAERLDITERFELVRVEIALALVGSTQLTNVEISELMTPASTYVSRGEWTYSVTLRERTAHAIPAGIFDVRLTADGLTRTVRLVQAVADPLLQEGARVTFDLGRELSPAALFVVSVREVPTGPVFELTSAINSSFQYVWRDDAQIENPLMEVALSDVVTFIVTNGDGTSIHNFQIQDGTDPIPATEDLEDLGDQDTLTWEPPSTGSFRYECRYHPTMSGTIQVTP